MNLLAKLRDAAIIMTLLSWNMVAYQLAPDLAHVLSRQTVALEAIAANSHQPIHLQLDGFSPEAAQVLADADTIKPHHSKKDN